MQVFGTIPENTIFLPDIPYQVRFNCKDGGLFVGGSEPEHRRSNPTDKVDISIIKIGKYYGDLGKTKSAIWLQLFFVAGVGVDPKILPQNTVCVSYIKRKSINNLNNVVAGIMAQKIEPATGIFTISFNREQGDLGVYYSVNFDWRERSTKEEKAQLETIQEFWSANNDYIIDLDGTRDMQSINGLTAQQINQLMSNPNHKQLTSAN
ncbi:hypothetical protein VKI21_02095 [Cyanobacterium aponinum UTEX 3222]|uniref:hypothetical protein n=1 Tax=Cyanobacterium aponinum TaxID=379064 RepID=UPI0030848172|nr:hypothetical protein VKI21_02095 [Cyanobacterium aponinum UTEX 3222]